MKKVRKYLDTSWDFRKANTKNLTHCFHSYPAMMIPQVAYRLIEKHINSKSKVNGYRVLDPFCGSGTVLVESKIRGLESWGIDINPLARIIAKVKITPIDINELQISYSQLSKYLVKIFKNKKGIKKYPIPDFFNIDYWFKPNVARRLSVIKTEILKLKNPDIVDFYKVIFSETIRESSNTRSGEFKLFRIPEEKLRNYDPDVLSIFLKKAERNINGMKDYLNILASNGGYKNTPVHILDEDTRQKTSISDGSIDLIVTSPPYGDSKTTVAYGQYSRLSLQWLDFDQKNCRTIDKISLGGKTTKENGASQISASLNRTLKKIERIDAKRAKDVSNFYNDMLLCLDEIKRIMAPKSNICFVVGNRTVKGIRIPTDNILVKMFNHFGFKHKETIIRNIPNKTMPLRNSPTNIPGKLEKTMWNEYIIIVGR